MVRSRPTAPPVHAGEVLKAEFLDEIGVSAYALAKALCVPANRITRSSTENAGSLRRPRCAWPDFFGRRIVSG